IISVSITPALSFDFFAVPHKKYQTISIDTKRDFYIHIPMFVQIQLPEHSAPRMLPCCGNIP
ncbi:MAG: hypothetical protein WBO80_10630, partial [Fusicatenibacter saccharivorans]